MSLESQISIQKKRLAAEDRALLASIETKWKTLEASLEPELKLLAQEYVSAKQAGRRYNLYQSPNYTNVIVRLNGELVKFSNLVTPIVEKRQAVMIRRALEDSWLNTRGAGRKLAESEFSGLIGRSQSGASLTSLLRSSYPASASLLTSHLINTAIKGGSPEDIVRSALNGLSGSALTRTMSSARTETYSVYRTVLRAQYGASGITLYRRQAVFDRRTCPSCIILSGKIYSMEEDFPKHVNCRCSMSPVLLAPEELARLAASGEFASPELARSVLEEAQKAKAKATPESAPSAPSPAPGGLTHNRNPAPPLPEAPVDITLTGEMWLKRQSHDLQREILGPGRLLLWLSGAVALHELIREKDTPHGPTVELVPLEELPQAA